MTWSEIYKEINNNGIYFFIALVAVVVAFLITEIVHCCLNCRNKKKFDDNYDIESQNPQTNPLICPLNVGNANISPPVFKQVRSDSESSLPLHSFPNKPVKSMIMYKFEEIYIPRGKKYLKYEKGHTVDIPKEEKHFTFVECIDMNIPKTKVNLQIYENVYTDKPKKDPKLNLCENEVSFDNNGENNRFVDISIVSKMQSDMEFMINEIEDRHKLEIENGNLTLKSEINSLKDIIKKLNEEKEQRENEILNMKIEYENQVQQAYREGEERCQFISNQYQIRMDEMKEIHQSLKQKLDKTE